MATNTIKARHIICAKTKTEWATSAYGNLVPLKGEFCLEIDSTQTDLNNMFKLKVGDGSKKYSELPYLFTTKTEIVELITAAIQELDSSATADASNVLTGITITDGKITAKTQVPYSTIAPIQSVSGTNPWINASKSGTTVTISHTDPSTADSGKSVTASDGVAIAGISIDAKGHVREKPTTKTLVTATSAESAGKIMIANGSGSTKESGSAISSTLTASSTTDVPTSKATADYVTAQIGSALASVLKYKGTVGTGGTVTTLPASHTVGDTYVVKTAGSYAGKACEVGDYIICNTTGTTATDSHWDVINGENQVEDNAATITSSSTTIATVDGTDITAKIPAYSTIAPVQSVVGGTKMTSTSKSGTTVTVNHDSTTRSDTTGATRTFGGNVITGVTTDATGHVTGVETSALPANPNTHYEAKLVTSDSATGKTDAAAPASDGSVYLNVVENDTVRSSHKIVSGDNVTVDINSSKEIHLSATDTTYTFAGGNQQFTVTPSGGTAQTVTVTPGQLTGDVTTASASGRATTIGNNKVTNAKLAQMAANTLKGNNTSSTANAKDLTVTEVKTMLGITNMGGNSLTSTPSSSTTTNDAKITSIVNGVTQTLTKASNPVYTSLLADDDNVTLILDGNF